MKAEIGFEGEMERATSFHFPKSETLLFPSADTVCGNRLLKTKNIHIAQTSFWEIFFITIIL